MKTNKNNTIVLAAFVVILILGVWLTFCLAQTPCPPNWPDKLCSLVATLNLDPNDLETTATGGPNTSGLVATLPLKMSPPSPVAVFADGWLQIIGVNVHFAHDKEGPMFGSSKPLVYRFDKPITLSRTVSVGQGWHVTVTPIYQNYHTFTTDLVPLYRKD